MKTFPPGTPGGGYSYLKSEGSLYESAKEPAIRIVVRRSRPHRRVATPERPLSGAGASKEEDFWASSPWWRCSSPLSSRLYLGAQRRHHVHHAFGFLIAMSTGGVMKVSDLNEFFPLRLFMILVGRHAALRAMAPPSTAPWKRWPKWAVEGSRGIVGMLPIIFFILSVVLAAIGPGSIATTVVLAPIGMALCAATRISPFLMTLMIVNGANAGALSPLAPTGIIAGSLV
ncbi:MAG: hypothetical protein MZV70_41555 [Desulfobacterales bacterium]|nr:hypothetical protein [Desulfobacterales bacterium]